MPTIHVEAQVSRDELLKAVEQLSTLELEQFVSEVLTLMAKHLGRELTFAEENLVQTIRMGLSKELRHRCAQLIAKRREETLTPEEYTELLDLTDQVEEQEQSRLRALAELAQVRKMPLASLMSDLGIQAPAHE